MDKDKIDIVYLWCNIDDPKFREKKEAFSKGLALHPQSNNVCRYKDNGELKFSLRSLEKYAPWINKVFIVTDNQVPDWLNIKHPKIKIINQNDILPKEAKPSFNSIAIEHCIANIPELSEYFLYANDDMFFSNYVEPEFFFNKKGYPICRFRRHRKNSESLYHNALKNAEDLIYEKYKILIDNEPHHNIDAYRKSDVLECKKVFEKEIQKTILSHFRKLDNIERAIYQKYFVATGRGEFKKVRRIDSKLPLILKLINSLTGKYRKDSCIIFLSERKAEYTLTKFQPKLFCMNDSEDTTDDDREYMKEILKKIYPEKSGFEI